METKTTVFGLMKSHITTTLDTTGESDSNYDELQSLVEDMGDEEIGDPQILEERLLHDPEVQEAFKKFVSGLIGSVQMMKDE